MIDDSEREGKCVFSNAAKPIKILPGPIITGKREEEIDGACKLPVVHNY